MSDLELRTAERSGDTAQVLRLRVRAGQVSQSEVGLWAYCGLEAAREVLGACPSCEALKGYCGYVTRCLACGKMLEGKTKRSKPLAAWAAGLPGLALGFMVDERCVWCRGSGNERGRPVRVGTPCECCEGTGTEKRDIGAQHLAVTACIGVARAVHPTGSATCTCLECDALEAAEDWRDNPTSAGIRREVNRLANENLERSDWAWQPLRMAYAWDGAAQSGLAVAFADAATHIGEKAVRTAAMEAVVPGEWR